jgi:hypothetical protein
LFDKSNYLLAIIYYMIALVKEMFGEKASRKQTGEGSELSS